MHVTPLREGLTRKKRNGKQRSKSRSSKKFGRCLTSYTLQKALKRKPQKTIARLLQKNILPKLGKRNLDEVERVEVVRLIDHVATRAPILANRTLGLLKQFFDWAIGRGDIAMNPALGIPKAMKETPRERILSLSEMRKIYSAAGHLSPANKLFIQMLLLTGQRAGVIAKTMSNRMA